MAIISQLVLPIAKLLNEALVIPDYQRPYKWQAKHVNQLLDDIINHQSKARYRLGTVVLNQESIANSGNENEKEVRHTQHAIVDGQQRLLTLTLLCSVLSTLLKDDESFAPKLLSNRFKSKVSIVNLQHNAQVIENRLKQLTGNHELKTLFEFVLNQCELIVVTLDNLSEAFQFFDSQNARGKALAPYDLLKAYHLREMMQGTDEKERLSYVNSWEQGVNPDDNTPSLHTIMGNLLFRMRRWIDGDNGTQFTRHNIEVFKGINLDTSKYRYVESMQALNFVVDAYNSDPIGQWDQQNKDYPFQVNQVMINGKRFFDFIQHYISLYSKLFSANDALLADMLKTHTVYKGSSSRKGDLYVKNLFICAVMYYYDKFGDIELKKAAEHCFIWSYRKRLELQKIGFESVDNHARSSDGLFKVINKAIHPQQVLNYNLPAVENVRYKNVPTVVNIFTELGYLQGGNKE